MTTPRWTVAVLAAGLLVCHLPGVGADDTAEPAVPPSLTRLVRQLDAEDFGQRREARERLAEAGPEAIAALQEGARTAGPHLAAECVNLLQQLAIKDNADLASAAQQSLQQLADGDHGDVTRLAKQALKPSQPVPESRPLKAGEVRIEITVKSGVDRAAKPMPPARLERSAEFEDGGRKVHLHEAADGKITVKITEMHEGQERTSEHSAPNIAELMRKNRAAFDLFLHNRHRLTPARAEAPARPTATGSFRRIRTQVIDGRREIDLTENSRRIQITDEDNRKIRATVTDITETGEASRTVEADDLEQLRAKEPELAKLLEQSNGAFTLKASPRRTLPPR